MADTDDSTLPFEIIQGRSKAIDLFLRDEEDMPIDLTSLTEFKAEVHATTGAPIEITKTAAEVVIIGSPLLGHVQLQFSAAKTALMALTNFDGVNVLAYTTLQIEVTITGNPDYNPNIKQIAGVLNILPQIT